MYEWLKLINMSLVEIIYKKTAKNFSELYALNNRSLLVGMINDFYIKKDKIAIMYNFNTQRQ